MTTPEQRQVQKFNVKNYADQNALYIDEITKQGGTISRVIEIYELKLRVRVLPDNRYSILEPTKNNMWTETAKDIPNKRERISAYITENIPLHDGVKIDTICDLSTSVMDMFSQISPIPT